MRRLAAALPAITQDYEVVFVEDSGGDGSWALICEFARQDGRVRGLQFSRNFGQHHALTAGMDYARGDWVVTMDCDLQDPPEAIKPLYDKAQEGYDLVLARRVGGGAEPLSSRLFYRIFDYLTGTYTDPAVGAFRIFSRRVCDNLATMREQSRFFGGLMQWLGFPSATVDVPRGARFAGHSTYNFRRRLRLAGRAILAFSNKPLVLVVNIGFVMSFVAFIYGLVITARKVIYGIPVEGWTSVIVSLYFLSGIILATLGVVGLYVGKALDEVKKRPLYIIRRTTFDG